MDDAGRQVILVVEDDPILRRLLAHGLESEGYLVQLAANGLEALHQAEQVAPALVLMDVGMPIMDGFTACRELRLRHTELPVLMLTGYDDVDSINTAFETGATDFITKPINLPLLTQRVRYALRDAERDHALRRAYQDQTTACRLANMGFWQLGIASGRMKWSADAHKLISQDRVLPSQVTELMQMVDPEQAAHLTTLFRAAISNQVPVDVDVVLRSSGRARVLRLITDAQQEDGQLRGAFQDVTEQRAIQQQVQYLAEHDQLTSLPNRRLFQRLLTLQRNQQNPDQRLVVAVLDICKLHRINDSLGSKSGDQLLMMVAQRLRSCLPKNAILARLEADSFALALPLSHASSTGISAQLDRLLVPLTQSWQLNARQIFLNFTLGFTSDNNNDAPQESLLQRAFGAQRQARPNKGISLCCHEQLPPGAEDDQLMLETELRQALVNQEFSLLYQPQQSLENGQIEGVEALVRWQHPRRGLLPPAAFITAMEDMGLIDELGEWVLAESCRQVALWQSRGLRIRTAVNLASSQFESSDLPVLVQRLCHETRCPPDMIELEITESMAMVNPQKTIEQLSELKRLGVRIAIDDFGVGHSSLEYLLHFPHDVLKVDRTFIKNITTSKGSRAIVRSLTAYCSAMGITCLAEGVEEQRQLDYLDALAVDVIQGFLLSRPITADEVETMVFQLATDNAQKQDVSAERTSA
ncbi:putative bifunctional diguanylate cyclase/phosphodiesterase [Halopseudomonas pelagia]|uniref:GGDEF domain-containing response regulator n=1 Tax=Halopseudomonas pelagia TaxID=553151 RepID=A0AA91Z707_9GAMM|nr:EAL domain-containing protein [Halopseudomonas pelagia]PCD00519.1 GGDEF domain-containing response regulator [Halopseudomonas pelagia]QFY55222.1 GGDEF domain-containing response regulator [Halopseudomonas pelagia]